jgi:starvation-inducible DNA-binding protein
MYQMQNTLSGKLCTKSATLPNLHLEVAIDLRAPQRHGHWTVRGASFIAVHVPGDWPTPSVADYADLLAERAGALGIVAGDTLQTPATAFFVKPDPLHGVDCLSLARAVAEALAAFDVRVGATIDQADDFDEINTPEILSEASRSVDQLLWLVESHIEASALDQRRS